jgi:hypothetical protein
MKHELEAIWNADDEEHGFNLVFFLDMVLNIN